MLKVEMVFEFKIMNGVFSLQADWCIFELGYHVFSNTPETGGCYEYNFKENTISFDRGPRSERGPGSARKDLFQGKFC